MSRPPSVCLEVSPIAETDLRRARDYIARDNPQAARDLIVKVFEVLRLVRQNPEIGARVLERNDGMRSATIPGFRAYRLYYQYDEGRSRLRVVRFLHTARDWAALLGQ